MSTASLWMAWSMKISPQKPGRMPLPMSSRPKRRKTTTITTTPSRRGCRLARRLTVLQWRGAIRPALIPLLRETLQVLPPAHPLSTKSQIPSAAVLTPLTLLLLPLKLTRRTPSPLDSTLTLPQTPRRISPDLALLGSSRLPGRSSSPTPLPPLKQALASILLTFLQTIPLLLNRSNSRSNNKLHRLTSSLTKVRRVIPSLTTTCLM
mmetsp:Transcript_9539/g.15874  ORF Transcript_9539/g.15874 Transcript_9539/m.15874 type:complete len:207 (+) Transcript_9539:378-998(+)